MQWKQTVQNFRLLNQRYAQFWLFRKMSGNSFSTTFYVWFFKKNVSHVTFILLYCLIAFTSWDIGLYGIAIVSFTGCDPINFEINLIFLIKPFLLMTKKSRQKFKYIENKKSFKVK